MTRIRAFLLTMAALLSYMPADSAAASLESLVMPGKVIAGHAKYEEECKRCHRRFSRGDQKTLCLDCHDKVAADVQDHKGFHGRNGFVTEPECRECHTEHVGRDANVVHLERETFNHGWTDFALEGGHVGIPCDSCHKADELFRDAPSACVRCHEEDDAHDGRLGEKCGDCHSPKGWATAAFDHDKTDFPLKGAHKKVACAFCHPNEQYEDVPQECVACHRLNDAHGGRYGKECDTCHTPKKWKESIFDHDRDTDYKLEGHHGKVACDSCHTGRLDEKLDTACHACHKNDDAHKGRYGEECDKCHTPRDWDRSVFDHDQDTEFPLRHAHKDAACIDCHRGVLFKDDTDSGCYACHRQDDVHKGSEGKKCERCHNDKAWAGTVTFDHDLTRFPLIGLHATAPCEECHVGSGFKTASKVCGDCHAAEDEHKGQLGPACGMCHTPNGWPLWEFDHDTRTSFALDGAHEELDCLACHRSVVRKKIRLSGVCGTCHGQDDIHGGEFGRRCDRCHTSEAFDRILVDK